MRKILYLILIINFVEAKFIDKDKLNFKIQNNSCEELKPSEKDTFQSEILFRSLYIKNIYNEKIVFKRKYSKEDSIYFYDKQSCIKHLQK